MTRWWWIFIGIGIGMVGSTNPDTQNLLSGAILVTAGMTVWSIWRKYERSATLQRHPANPANFRGE